MADDAPNIQPNSGAAQNLVNQLVSEQVQHTKDTTTLKGARDPRVQGPPQPRPILLDLFKNLSGHGQYTAAPGQPATRPSRVQGLEDFLGNFIQALGAGFGNQGHGPGSFGRGFGAAMQAPYQQSLQQYGLQQQQQLQQAQIEEQRARTGQIQAASTPQTITDPTTGKPVTVLTGQVGGMVGSLGRGYGAAQVSAQSRMSVAQFQALNGTGIVKKWQPVNGPNGPMMQGFNKFGQPVEGATVDNAFFPQLAQSVSSTIDWKPQEDGSFVALPKTTVSQKVPVGGGAPNTSGGGNRIPRPATSGGSGVRIVNGVAVGSDGKPIQGQRSMQSRSRADAASSLKPLIGRVRELLKDPDVANNMGMIAGRWSDVQKKAGNLPPKMRELAGTLTSIYSLAGTMHGWRALQVAQEFQKTYGGLEADPASLLGGMDAMDKTADAVYSAGYGNQKAQPQSAGSTTKPKTASDYLKSKGF